MKKKDQLYQLDILIYQKIKNFTNKSDIGYCFMSNETMSNTFHRSTCSISRSISKLKKLGYVENIGNKYARKLITTDKIFNISDNSISINAISNGISDNSISINAKTLIAFMIKAIDITAKEQLTKTLKAIDITANIHIEHTIRDILNEYIEESKNNNKNDFDVFYSAYPAKKSKQAAIKAFNKAIKNTSLQTILDGLKRYIENKEDWKQYQNPATWLNGECWLDEYSNTQENISDIDSKALELIRKNIPEHERGVYTKQHSALKLLKSGNNQSYKRLFGDVTPESNKTIPIWLKQLHGVAA